ncbi:helix-turn-helix domain-containing protein [Cohnella caldifontis]|uniref:helix-turn-helix domain-containing protein n=1 Tax=Cohnella caldifontis TaxID=3027471 RepID=UPI0030DBCE90
MFSRYVGVSPKWVIRRFRLQEAAELIDKDGASDWAALSAKLGYYDQAHFIKDFKAVTGRSPEAYAREAGQLRANGRSGS